MFASLDSLGELKPIISPSGMEVTLTPDEERHVVKDALQERIREKMTYDISIVKSLITAAGSALGLAVGALLVQWMFKKR